VQKASEILLRPASIVDFNVMCEVELNHENKDYTTLEMPDVNDIRAFLLAGQNIHKDCQIRYAVIHQGIAIGFVDLSDVLFTEQSAAVGVYILKHFRDSGFAKQALSLLKSIALENGIYLLVAEVKPSNISSIKLFLAAGYDEVHPNHDFRRFEFKIPTEAK